VKPSAPESKCSKDFKIVYNFSQPCELYYQPITFSLMSSTIWEWAG